MNIPTEKPNILVFMTDQQHHATIGSDSACHTPNLDRLIGNGVRFANAFCPSPICTPSRSSFQTGLFPHQHKQTHNIHRGKNCHLNERFPDGTILLGDALQAEGYRTGYVGKWDSGLEKSPLDHGYQVFDPDPGNNGSQEPVTLRDHIRIPGEPDPRRALISAVSDQNPNDTGPMKIAAKTVELIEEWSSNPGQPFYIFASTVQPHVPWICPQAYSDLHNPDKIPVPDNYHDEFANRPGSYLRHYNMHNYCHPDLPWEEMARAITHYYGVISLVDDAFGLVLDALKKNDIVDDTVIVFTSDHGEHMGAHGLIGKGDNLLDELVRVPLVISWPEHFKVGTSDTFVNLTDLFATIMSLTGAETPVPEVSRNMEPLLYGQASGLFPDIAFCEHNGFMAFNTVRAIRTARFKYVFRPNDFDELYDLLEDPDETINLICNPDYRAIIADLQEQLLGWMEQTHDMAFRAGKAILSHERWSSRIDR